MGLLFILISPFYYGLKFLKFVGGFWFSVVETVISFAMALINSALTLLVLMEEAAIFCIVLPWTPTDMIGQIFGLLRKTGIPSKIPFILFVIYTGIVILLNIIGMELYYLQVSDELKTGFEEFKGNLLTSIKLFVVIHKFLVLISDDVSLKGTCQTLTEKLEKGQNKSQNSVEENWEIEELKQELEKTKQELRLAQMACSHLQQQNALSSRVPRISITEVT